eukprot:CAMPEP_0184692280 /NCGR_PEP_ID=MMETSP0313-20130426/833_1 /TAXON_ID=2792 /ORGANISM="Porphyridium aerugineum, Strain SAG 1380-2" /LENGTH=50 /DNA_ID=CAMNT_0027150105 /DNA_START=80 /DNA_END=232 /DNA_ORIENTATION=+
MNPYQLDSEEQEAMMKAMLQANVILLGIYFSAIRAAPFVIDVFKSLFHKD